MNTLDQIFGALADSTRRAILARLALGEATVTELMEPFALSQPAISRHLKVLETAGLISTRQDGTARPRKLEPAALEAASQWLDTYRAAWEANFNRLDDVLAGLNPSPPSQED